MTLVPRALERAVASRRRNLAAWAIPFGARLMLLLGDPERPRVRAS